MFILKYLFCINQRVYYICTSLLLLFLKFFRYIIYKFLIFWDTNLTYMPYENLHICLKLLKFTSGIQEIPFWLPNQMFFLDHIDRVKLKPIENKSEEKTLIIDWLGWETHLNFIKIYISKGVWFFEFKFRSIRADFLWMIINYVHSKLMVKII